MNNKTLIVTNIIILVCIIIGLIWFMFWGFNLKFNFGGVDKKIIKTENFKIEDIKSIISDVKSYDLVLTEGKSDEVKVEFYSSDKNKNNLNIVNKNGALTVEQTGSSICFGFCNMDSEIIIYVPSGFLGKINFSSNSGDIEVLTDLLGSDYNIKTTSGDIALGYLNTCKIRSISGSVSIDKGKSVDIATTSGDVIIDKLEEASIKTVSGEIDINNLLSGGNFNTTSGDIEINNFMIDKNTRFETTSGEIEINLLNEALINVSTVSGEKDIKSSYGEYKLDVKTVSGDVKIK